MVPQPEGAEVCSWSRPPLRPWSILGRSQHPASGSGLGSGDPAHKQTC